MDGYYLDETKVCLEYPTGTKNCRNYMKLGKKLVC